MEKKTKQKQSGNYDGETNERGCKIWQVYKMSR